MAKTEINHNLNKDPDTSGSSITHWFVEAEEITADNLKKDQAKISPEELVEGAAIKVAGLRFLEENNLPRYQKVMVNLKSFLHNPKRVFDRLSSQSGLYYSSIVNLKTGERLFGLEQTQEEVKKFIKEKLKTEEISIDSQLILSEYWRNYYGGNLVINKRGKVFVELVEGKHAKLNKGQGPILLSAKTSEFSKTLQFNENQAVSEEQRTQLRQAIVKAINLLPQHLIPLSQRPSSRFKEAVSNENGEASVFVPISGYFEFILTKKDEKTDNLEVIFIDARTGVAADKYQLLA
jgi:hypothetical protein